MTDLMYADVYAQNGAVGLDGPQGIMGVQHYERGLMFVETYQSGHVSCRVCLADENGPLMNGRCNLSSSLEWLTDISNGCLAVSTPSRMYG